MLGGGGKGGLPPEACAKGGGAQLGERVLCKHEVVGSIPIASTIARPVVHPWKIEIRELAPGRRLVLFDSVDRNFSGERLLASRAARLWLGVCREIGRAACRVGVCQYV